MEDELRRIPLSRRSHVAGFQALDRMAEHESALEGDFVTLASFMDASAVVTAQPVTIHFEQRGAGGDTHRTFASTGAMAIARSSRSNTGLTPSWLTPLSADFCGRAKLRTLARSRIATERGIRFPQLDNAKRLLPLGSAPVDTVLAEGAVAHACAHAVSFGDLIDALPISREASLAEVWRLIARGALIVGLTMPITSKSRETAGGFPRVDCREYSVVKYSSIDLSRIHGDTGDSGAQFDKVPAGCRPVSGGTRPPCRYRPHVHQFD
ncbi:hypothetical protein ABIG06_001668 [Bradyrhizobium sp. USDA 326]|uniref:hypothetical protein n=1 Tax=unclassified Bradyrhizobium TaxID=2631580 RepID=UPI00351519FD